jgi:flagellar M-ring protein FliF
VTVIDSPGRPLKEIVPAVASSEAEKLNVLKLHYEQEIERRIETMLDPVLGPGKVVVRANVQLNLQETQMTREEFDPENRVVRSQRSMVDDTDGKIGGKPGVQANIPGGDASKLVTENGSKRSNESVTYEVGRTTSRISEPRGQIQKISVAVLVDGKYEKDKYSSRSAEEMEVIKGVVKRAVGFDGERGDELEVANVPFKIQPATPLKPVIVPELKDMLMSPTAIGVGVGVIVVVGALLFFLMRGKKTQIQVKSQAATAEPAAAAVPIRQEVQEQVTVAAQKIVLTEDPRKEQISQIARDYHDATVRIIRTWLQEDANKARSGNGNGTGIEVTS